MRRKQTNKMSSIRICSGILHICIRVVYYVQSPCCSVLGLIVWLSFNACQPPPSILSCHSLAVPILIFAIIDAQIIASNELPVTTVFFQVAASLCISLWNLRGSVGFPHNEEWWGCSSTSPGVLQLCGCPHVTAAQKLGHWIFPGPIIFLHYSWGLDTIFSISTYHVLILFRFLISFSCGLCSSERE